LLASSDSEPAKTTASSAADGPPYPDPTDPPDYTPPSPTASDGASSNPKLDTTAPDPPTDFNQTLTDTDADAQPATTPAPTDGQWDPNTLLAFGAFDSFPGFADRLRYRIAGTCRLWLDPCAGRTRIQTDVAILDSAGAPALAGVALLGAAHSGACAAPGPSTPFRRYPRYASDVSANRLEMDLAPVPAARRSNASQVDYAPPPGNRPGAWVLRHPTTGDRMFCCSLEYLPYPACRRPPPPAGCGGTCVAGLVAATIAAVATGSCCLACALKRRAPPPALTAAAAARARRAAAQSVADPPAALAPQLAAPHDAPTKALTGMSAPSGPEPPSAAGAASTSGGTDERGENAVRTGPHGPALRPNATEPAAHAAQAPAPAAMEPVEEAVLVRRIAEVELELAQVDGFAVGGVAARSASAVWQDPYVSRIV
jgi:hypothetical protein